MFFWGLFQGNQPSFGITNTTNLPNQRSFFRRAFVIHSLNCPKNVATSWRIFASPSAGGRSLSVNPSLVFLTQIQVGGWLVYLALWKSLLLLRPVANGFDFWLHNPSKPNKICPKSSWLNEFLSCGIPKDILFFYLQPLLHVSRKETSRHSHLSRGHLKR